MSQVTLKTQLQVTACQARPERAPGYARGPNSLTKRYSLSAVPNYNHQSSIPTGICDGGTTASTDSLTDALHEEGVLRILCEAGCLPWPVSAPRLHFPPITKHDAWVAQSLSSWRPFLHRPAESLLAGFVEWILLWLKRRTFQLCILQWCLAGLRLLRSRRKGQHGNLCLLWFFS